MSEALDIDWSHLNSGAPEVDNCIPSFYEKAKPNVAKSKETGKPEYITVEMVRILIPGDTKSEVDRPVKDEDKIRWPEQYKRFQEKQAGHHQGEGTPLEEFPVLDAAKRATLKAHRIHTVDALSAVTDEQCMVIGEEWCSEMRQHATRYCQIAGDESLIYQTMEQNEALKAEVADLQKQLADAKKPKKAAK